MRSVALVIHTERLSDPVVVDALRRLGPELTHVRPLLVCVTPFSPVYGVPPDPDNITKYRAAVDEVSHWFDIGYHGHFTKGDGVLTEDPKVIWGQFGQEVSLLKSLGHDPKVYAGGWWILNDAVKSALEFLNFEFDTTANQTRKTSYGELQPVQGFKLGKGFFLSRSVFEVPTITSLPLVTKHLFTKDPGHILLTFHDFDLVSTDRFTKLRLEYIRRLLTKPTMKLLEEARVSN